MKCLLPVSLNGFLVKGVIKCKTVPNIYLIAGLMASIGGSEAFLFVNTGLSKKLYPDIQFIFKSTIVDHDHQLLRVMNKKESVCVLLLFYIYFL